ncbi:MAG TPA: PTS sugar transporter subunit IIA [Candidatus Hydrogenedentes bacterium]|nr:PTS sugar transporter subunit IIA [Candidatus Hydrogenedentota bacterium]
MVITDYIAENCILPEMRGKTKPEALKELTHLLFDTKKLKGVDAALDQIMARESTESTGIGHGIAVPHARITGLKTLHCAVGRFKEGVDFTAIDRKPVHLVFLICYPPTQQTTYLNFVATVAKLLHDTSHLASLLNASTAEALLSVLRDLCLPLDAPEVYYAQPKGKALPKILETRDAHADIILLARLQLCYEILETARTGKRQINERIANIRSLVDPRILRQFDRLMKSRPPALVPVEADTCQGCFMKLPSQFAQLVRAETNVIHSCTNCRRFIYIV